MPPLSTRIVPGSVQRGNGRRYLGVEVENRAKAAGIRDLGERPRSV
jgi:hypothetical protein